MESVMKNRNQKVIKIAQVEMKRHTNLCKLKLYLLKLKRFRLRAKKQEAITVP